MFGIGGCWASVGFQRLARDARLQIENHVPETVDLASLNYFEGLQAIELIVRGGKPLGDELRLYHLSKP